MLLLLLLLLLPPLVTTTCGVRGEVCREAITLLMASREMIHDVCRRGDAEADPVTAVGAGDRCMLMSGCNGNTGVVVGGGSGGTGCADDVGGNGRDDNDEDTTAAAAAAAAAVVVVVVEEAEEELRMVDSVDAPGVVECAWPTVASCSMTVTLRADAPSDAVACMVANTGMGTVTGSTCTRCNTARCGGST